MKIKLFSILLAILFSLSAWADGYYPEPMSQDQPWAVTASIGGGKYPHIYTKDSTNIIGRLALSNELILTGDFSWGLELGLQNGNKVRLALPTETIAVLEWLPVQTSLGPMFDLLVTAKSDPLVGSSLFAQLKGGIAYRYWQIENQRINDKSQISGEIQAGFGYPLTTLANLNLLYQGVFGSNPNLYLNTYNKSGHMSNAPILHGLLLGFSVSI